jgi:uncharacterized protein (DUF433 family)
MVANSSLISINPEIRFGKPCISGTRICVTDILQWLASGMTIEEILIDYPKLTQESIFAVLAFSANREAMIKTIIV